MKILLLLTLLFTGFAHSAKDLKFVKGDSKIAFSIFKMKIDSWVDGEFKNFDGSGKYDASSKMLSDITGTVETKTVNTNEKKRDDHLRTKDFFDVENFPKLTFKQGKPVKVEGDFKLSGTLTIKGISKKITLKMKRVSNKSDTFNVSGETIINRTDYKVDWNKKSFIGIFGRLVLSEDVTIKINLKDLSIKN